MTHFDLRIGRRDLAATLFKPDVGGPKRAGILFIHGQGSSRAGYRPRAAAVTDSLAAVSLTFDLSGHGESSSDRQGWLLEDHVADVLDAYDALVAEPSVDPDRIGVCGASYGAYLAGKLAASRAVSRLLLRAPGLYADTAMNTRMDRLESGSDIAAQEFFQGINRSGAEILVLESELDEVIPHAVIESYLRGCPRSRHMLLSDATHALTNPQWDEKFILHILEWFSDL